MVSTPLRWGMAALAASAGLGGVIPLAWADDSLWVSYTELRQRIAWQRFSLAAPSP